MRHRHFSTESLRKHVIVLSNLEFESFPSEDKEGFIQYLLREHFTEDFFHEEDIKLFGNFETLKNQIGKDVRWFLETRQKNIKTNAGKRKLDIRINGEGNKRQRGNDNLGLKQLAFPPHGLDVDVDVDTPNFELNWSYTSVGIRADEISVAIGSIFTLSDPRQEILLTLLNENPDEEDSDEDS